jgi:hypothetical protein
MESDVQDEKQYWFPAKSFGWGWGLPATWQGWLVLAGFIALVALGTVFLKPATHVLAFGIYVGILALLLVAVCWIKGEPPSWRWGK